MGPAFRRESDPVAVFIKGGSAARPVANSQ
jgi:hypothetical protein